MVYILFYRIGHENNADVLDPSLVTFFVLLLITLVILILLVRYRKKIYSRGRGYIYRDKGNYTKYQTCLSGN